MYEMEQQTTAAHESQTPETVWASHIQRAVSKFLKTAVVIDNQPSIDRPTKTSTLEDSGLDGDIGALTPPEYDNSNERAHDLDLRSVSNVFSENGVACAFVLPDDIDKDSDRKLTRAVSASKVSDIVVIDWYLEPKNSSLTLKILEEVAKSDTGENGRLRLICVYTGEPLNTSIFEDVKKYLKNGGIIAENIAGETYAARSENTLVVLKNKRDTPAEDLPKHLITEFSRLADGLIPAFALAAVGAIRNNTHHMLTRFGANLDSAYISNRLITNPPGDVAELMRELLVAECDNALGLDKIADEFLEQQPILHWLDVNSERLNPVDYKEKINGTRQTISLDREKLDGLLHYGVGDKDFTIDGEQRIPFPEFHRYKVSETLAGNIEKSRSSESEFSRLVAFRREAYGSTTRLINPDWRPSLTTGTILKLSENGNEKYLMCFTPACDTLRLTEPRPFVFIEGSANDKPYNVVVIEAGGEPVGIHFDKKYPIVRTFLFTPDAQTQRVHATKIDEAERKFSFTSNDEQALTFEWLGEIRYSRAASEMASLANIWMRVGIVDSEYLRLASKGHIKFK